MSPNLSLRLHPPPRDSSMAGCFPPWRWRALANSERCGRVYDYFHSMIHLISASVAASEDSPFEYIAGKARAAAALRASGVESYAIARPCGIFGDTPNEASARGERRACVCWTVPCARVRGATSTAARLRRGACSPGRTPFGARRADMPLGHGAR